MNALLSGLMPPKHAGPLARHSDQCDLQIRNSLRALDELRIECNEVFGCSAAGQMQRIGKVESRPRPIKASGYGAEVLAADVGQSDQCRAGIDDPDNVETIQATQDPFGFEKHRRRDEDRLPLERDLARFACAGSSSVSNQTTTSVSTATTVFLHLCVDRSLHLLQRSHRPIGPEATGDILDSGRRDGTGWTKEDAVRGILDDELGAR